MNTTTLILSYNIIKIDSNFSKRIVLTYFGYFGGFSLIFQSYTEKNVEYYIFIIYNRFFLYYILRFDSFCCYYKNKSNKGGTQLNSSTQYIAMGKRIQARRRELRIKQGELAERLNISNNHISSIENGREKPSLDILLKICEELKVTPDYLLLGNIHANNIPQNIVDGLRLCSKDDIELARQFIEILIHKNMDKWNDNHFL